MLQIIESLQHKLLVQLTGYMHHRLIRKIIISYAAKFVEILWVKMMDDATCATIFIIIFITVEILWVKIMDDATCMTIFIIIFITC